jgi:tetratricopeptide (TPR) repeat protein
MDLVSLALVLATRFLFQDEALVRARLLAESGNARQAIAFLDAHVLREPSASAFALKAQLEAASGALPRAVASLDRALELAPDQTALRVTRGAMLFELRRYEDARVDLERAIRERPSSGLAHYYLGALQRSTGDLEAAQASASKAVELMPAETEISMEAAQYAPKASALHLLAEIQTELGMDAEPTLRLVLAIEPLHASAHYLLARSLLGRGQKEAADEELALFDRIKRADPHVALGIDLSRIEGRSQAAIAELRRAVEICPEHSLALFLLGRELLRAGKIDEAAPFLDRAVALKPALASEVDRLRASIR